MSSEIIKVKYIECNRGGFHDGELLNIVCLNQECTSNSLCCCVCVDELHKGHHTTTLKKILIESKETAKLSQSQDKESVKQSAPLNNDIICNLVESSRKDTFEELKLACKNIRSSLEKIEEGLNEYYTQIEQALNSQDNSNPSMKIFETVENIQGASNLISMQSALSDLLTSLEKTKQDKLSKSNRKELAQNSIINLIESSNREVVHSTMNSLCEIQAELEKSNNLIKKSTNNVKNLFNKEVFYFSSELKSNDIWVTDSSKVVSKKGKQYQIALMEPCISPTDDATAFRFKINKTTSNWVAIGMCYKKILEKKNFVFDYKTLGHGCYMISSNAGSWSSISEELNNKVKSFTFNEGDIITCIVNKAMREIFFTKELKPGMTSTQREIYELPYNYDPSDQLHPCVVFYFENDEVEYLPAINLNSLPRYDYLFSTVEKHPRIQVIDNKIIKAMEGNAEYRSVLLNKSLEENFQTSKKFSFKILKSTSNWVAVGMCHSKTAANFCYGFDFKAPFHGYYMISSNGGTWSTIDSTKNNLLKAFKFAEGDTIECEVVFGESPTDPENKIIFRKGIDKYELNFKGIAGDKLYPCAMLHFSTDAVSILPTF